MTTVVEQPEPKNQERRTVFQTKVSRYDQVSALLVALVVIVSFFATLLFLLWLTTIIVVKPKMPAVHAIQDLRGRGDHAQGTAREFEEPGVEELPDVPEPQLADALAAVTDAVSTQQALNEEFEGNTEQMGTGRGKGDAREAGPGGDGDLDVIPPWERWQIRYSTNSVDDYAKQLDHFKIELGAISQNTPRVLYARNLSAANPIRRSGTRGEDSRLFFVHPINDELVELSRALLAKAGISTEGHFIAQFYPDGTLANLSSVEQRSLGGRSLSTVRKTVFGVRQGSSGIEYYVIRHDFKPGT